LAEGALAAIWVPALGARGRHRVPAEVDLLLGDELAQLDLLGGEHLRHMGPRLIVILFV